jgi:hypothetical protein
LPLRSRRQGRAAGRADAGTLNLDGINGIPAKLTGFLSIKRIWLHGVIKPSSSCLSFGLSYKRPQILAYWIELQLNFADVCREENVDLATRILIYADWCLEQPQGETAEDDLSTCVHFCFLEHLSEVASAKKSRATFLEAMKKAGWPLDEEYLQTP